MGCVFIYASVYTACKQYSSKVTVPIILLFVKSTCNVQSTPQHKSEDENLVQKSLSEKSIDRIADKVAQGGATQQGPAPSKSTMPIKTICTKI